MSQDIVSTYNAASRELWASRKTMTLEFLHRMGREAKQGAIGLVIDRDYLEIGFPLEDSVPSRSRKGRKRGGK